MTPAAQLATLLIDAFGVKGKPDLAGICHRLGLRIREVDADGYEGALVRSRSSQKGLIAIRRDVREASRKRFTIAHEIGHFIIPYHRELGNVCTSRSVERFGGGISKPELEANEFAAELLLPTRSVRGALNLREPTLADIGTVAQGYETSLTATTYRYMDLCDLRCAMIWSECGKAVWFHRTDAFPFVLPLDALPAGGSIASRLFSGEVIAEGLHRVAPDLWLDRQDAGNVALFLEDSRYMPTYDAVLSLIWIVDLHLGAMRPEDQELLAELNPEDFTLQRKRWPR